MTELKKAFETLTETVEAFKTKNDELQADLKKKGDADVLLKNEVDRINEALGEAETKYEEAVAAMNRPAKVQTDSKGNELSEQEVEHKESYVDYFLTGNRESEEKAKELGKTPELKLIQVGVAGDGGLAVPTEIDTDVTQRFVEVDSMREVATVKRVSTTNWSHLTNRRGAATGWVGETDTRAETVTSTLDSVDAVFGELFAYPFITQHALEDPFFDLEGWMNDEVATEMALQEADSFVNGDAVKKPQGLFQATTALTADDTRAWKTYQHIVTGVSADFAATNKADKLIDLQDSLKRGYRANARWMMNRTTKTAIRKFKDGQGNYLLTFPTRPGDPTLLLSDPVVENVHVPDIAADSLSIAYGDFRRGYMILDIGNMVMLRNPFVVPGKIGLYHSKRVGGMRVDSEAIRFLKFGT